MNPPKKNEIEITLLGPGFGESLVIHLGDDRWIIIDSCIDSETNAPAALGYLKNIGVDSASSVSHVIATHWHDDHVGGLFEVLDACRNATFCCAAALASRQFLDLVAVFNKRPIAVSTGLSEIEKVLHLLIKRDARPHWVLGDMPIVTVPATPNAPEARITALSPVNAEFDRFLRSLAKYVPGNIPTTKHRFPRPNENDISIAALLVVGDACALLGADLETTSDTARGWNAVLTSTNRPKEIASLFKVPHHGSETGHHAKVWSDLLTPEPVAILTPWNRGSKLPTRVDRARIASFAGRSFITTRESAPETHRDYAIAKSIRESNITVSTAESRTGRITARIPFDAKASGVQWSIDMSAAASDLRY
ncbi:MBL fold metallo-hydrolase [Bradyrhizobium jicamae]|uniref:MBL fold metallo-hydrolase n=1 Tax=Bradyrhizobium jicamae TaxID=280332 RepID=A0ABS5FH57_9BRAD|nr:MBL fold metallo-hydrolase [Bradyrhizobium jicamae]MBR0796117.1 MBL fold metallo-hydrolase [Bradyrhizobium jicamae]